MPCPHCDATPAFEQSRRTACGYRTFRCRQCRKHISFQYPLVELATALLFVSTQFYRPVLPSLWLQILLGLCLWLLLIISVLDARTQLMPDTLNIPLIG